MTPLPEPTQAPDLRFPIAWAIGIARAKGFAIGFGGFIDSDWRRCCPMGAVVIADANGRIATFSFAEDVAIHASRVLSVDRLRWLNGFVSGFDFDGEYTSHDATAYALGREFRRALDEGRL